MPTRITGRAARTLLAALVVTLLLAAAARAAKGPFSVRLEIRAPARVSIEDGPAAAAGGEGVLTLRAAGGRDSLPEVVSAGRVALRDGTLLRLRAVLRLAPAGSTARLRLHLGAPVAVRAAPPSGATAPPLTIVYQ